MKTKRQYTQVINHVNSQVLDNSEYGIIESYKNHLEKYGVSDVAIRYDDMDVDHVMITMTLYLENQKEPKKASFKQYVDHSALEASNDFLEALCGLNHNEIKLLNQALDKGEDLAEMEPVLWNYLGQEYALTALAFISEWLDSDERNIVELFDLKIRKKHGA